MQKSLLVADGEVAGVVPPPSQRFLGRLGHLPVAEHQELAPAEDLAGRCGADVHARGVDDADVDVERRLSHGGRFAQHVVRPKHGHRPGFGGAVDDDHGGGGKALPDRPHLILAHRRRAAGDQPQ